MTVVSDALTILFFSVAPFSELRGGIPLGILMGYNPYAVFFFSTLANLLIILPVLFGLEWFDQYFRKLKVYHWSIERVRKKSRALIDRYGAIGLMIFVAVPLPGTGAWSGALAAYVFGMKKKKSGPAIAAGVLIAGIIVLLTCLFFTGLQGLFTQTV